MGFTRSIRVTLALLLLASISACVPQLEPPTFRLVLEGSGLVRFDPPVIGAGEAIFRINLEATNPNTVALTFTDISFDLFINDRVVGQGQTSEKVRLPPTSSERFAVTVTIPLSQVPDLITDIEQLIAGEPTYYRVEGTATAEVVGFQRRLSSVVIAEGTIVQPFPLPALLER